MLQLRIDRCCCYFQQPALSKRKNICFHSELKHYQHILSSNLISGMWTLDVINTAVEERGKGKAAEYGLLLSYIESNHL